MAFYILISFVWIIGLIISYFFLRPYIPLIKQNRKKAIKLFLLLLVLSAISYGLVCLVDDKTPVDEEVKLLKEDRKTMDQLGSLVSYGYKFVMEQDSPAYYKFSLNGSSATIYYSMKVERDSKRIWQMKSLRQDSIIKK